MVSVDTDLLQVSEADGVLTVEFARPDSLNALTPEMIEGLATVFEQLQAEPGPGVLIDGQGRVSCAGMDRDIVSGDYAAEFAELNETLGELYDDAMTYPRPVAVCGRGALVGAAAILSMSAEFLVLGDDATFAFPEVRFDIPSERIVTNVADVAGRRVAAELALTGEAIDPERAGACGLATDVVPADEVRPRARELLETVGGHDEETVATLIGHLAAASDRQV